MVFGKINASEISVLVVKYHMQINHVIPCSYLLLEKFKRQMYVFQIGLK